MHVIVDLISAVCGFLWGDLITLPLPGGGSVGLSLLVLLLIPTGIYFTFRTRFLPIRLFPGQPVSFHTAEQSTEKDHMVRS